MKIAIYSGEIPGTTFVEHLVRGVASSSHQVLLFGTRRSRVDYKGLDVIQDGCPAGFFGTVLFVMPLFLKLFFLRHGHFKIVSKKISKNARGVRHAIRLWSRYAPVVWHRPDVFHLQWIRSAEDWLFLTACEIRLVGSFRGAQLNWGPIVNPDTATSYRRAFPQFDAFHAVSETIAKKATQYGADLKKICVVRPAVDRKLLEYPLMRLPSVGSGRLLLLSVGRDHWKKGYRYSLDACAELLRHGIEFDYTIVVGNDCEALSHQRDQLKLNNHVHLVGTLPHDQVLKLYQASDLFILPSLEEGIANVVLESMALGCPVLSSDCGGMEEVINDGSNGLVFPITDTGALVTQIRRFQKMTIDEVEHMRLNARETIRKNHLLNQQITDMVTLYECVMDGTSVPKAK